MELSLTIKLTGVSESLVSPASVQQKGKIIQVRSKEPTAREAVCALCGGSGHRDNEVCHKCEGEGKFPSEYLLRINGIEEGPGSEVIKEAREWAISRGLKITSKLILREQLAGDQVILICNTDGSRFQPSDRSGTIYTYRAFLVRIIERPAPDQTVGKIDLVEIRGHRSNILPLYTFKSSNGDVDPIKDVEILPDAIRTSKFFPTETVRAAIRGERWSSAR